MAVGKRMAVLGLVFIALLVLVLLLAVAGTHGTVAPVATPEQAPVSDTEPDTASAMAVGVVFESANESVADQDSHAAQGEFPRIWASYRETLGFRRYAREMESLGSVFFAYSRRRNGVVRLQNAGASVVEWDLTTMAGEPFGMPDSPFGKPSSIQGEPSLARVLNELDVTPQGTVYVARSTEVERHIQRSIARVLRDAGIGVETVTGVQGSYRMINGRLSLVLERCALRSGESRKIEAVVPLKGE